MHPQIQQDQENRRNKKIAENEAFIRERIEQLLRLPVGAMTEDQKSFIRARSSYLYQHEKEYFSEVLDEAKRKPGRPAKE